MIAYAAPPTPSPGASTSAPATPTPTVSVTGTPQEQLPVTGATSTVPWAAVTIGVVLLLLGIVLVARLRRTRNES